MQAIFDAVMPEEYASRPFVSDLYSCEYRAHFVVSVLQQYGFRDVTSDALRALLILHDQDPVEEVTVGHYKSLLHEVCVKIKHTVKKVRRAHERRRRRSGLS